MNTTSRTLEPPFGEIFDVEGDGSVLSMRLPDNEVFSMTLSAWICSKVLDAKVSRTRVVHSFSGTFIPITQFSLATPNATPLFRAFGDEARKALEAVKEGYLTFCADDFDEDGYLKTINNR